MGLYNVVMVMIIAFASFLNCQMMFLSFVIFVMESALVYRLHYS